jgi:HAMP domain-containing protein
MNLRTKLILPIVLITAVVSLIAAYLVAKHEEREALERAQTLTAEHIAAKARVSLTPENFQDHDFRRQTPVFEGFLQQVRTPEILKIKVFNAKFDIIYSTVAGDIGAKTDSSVYRQALQDGKVLSVIKPPLTEKSNIELQGYRQLMEVYIPIVYDDRTEGVIEAYFKMDEINEDVRSTVVQIVGLVVLLAAMICAVVYVIMTADVVRPLNGLTTAARKLAGQEPGVTPPFIGTKDEIGKLRDAMVQVIEALDPHRKKRFLKRHELRHGGPENLQVGQSRAKPDSPSRPLGFTSLYPDLLGGLCDLRQGIWFKTSS